jgi:hypothetical protein
MQVMQMQRDRNQWIEKDPKTEIFVYDHTTNQHIRGEFFGKYPLDSMLLINYRVVESIFNLRFSFFITNNLQLARTVCKNKTSVNLNPGVV